MNNEQDTKQCAKLFPEILVVKQDFWDADFVTCCQILGIGEDDLYYYGGNTYLQLHDRRVDFNFSDNSYRLLANDHLFQNFFNHRADEEKEGAIYELGIFMERQVVDNHEISDSRIFRLGRSNRHVCITADNYNASIFSVMKEVANNKLDAFIAMVESEDYVAAVYDLYLVQTNRNLEIIRQNIGME